MNRIHGGDPMNMAKTGWVLSLVLIGQNAKVR